MMPGFNELVMKVVEYLQSTRDGKASLGKVARAVDRSPGYLARSLSQIEGDEVIPGKTLRLVREGRKLVLVLEDLPKSEGGGSI